MRKIEPDIILFTHGPKAYAPKRMAEEAEKMGYGLSIFKYNDLSISFTTGALDLKLKGEKMPIPHGVFLRGLGEDSIYNPMRTAIIAWFRYHGAKVLNERSFDKWPSLDKTTQHIYMSTSGIPVVPSFSFSSKDELKDWSKNAYPYIAKDIIGSNGVDVFKLSNDADLDKLLERYNSNFKLKALLFQSFLPGATDLRVIVLGGKTVGAMKRTALPGNYLSNYSQGGTVEPYDITKDLNASRIVEDTLKLFRLDYGGIDLMKNAKGEWVVLEVNRACQFEGFEKATKINVASRLVEFLAN